MLMLYVCTGCDYLSYFRFLGKVQFLNTFHQYAGFINGIDKPGYLINTTDDREYGFLSFLRLVGSTYFKKHLSAFVAHHRKETPEQLYHSVDINDPRKKHKEWFSIIRCTVANLITAEEDRVPSITSLWRHWCRSCWIFEMWQHCHLEDIYITLPLPETSGWKRDRTTGSYSIDWESEEETARVSDTINFLTNGCACKKGCTSK